MLLNAISMAEESIRTYDLEFVVNKPVDRFVYGQAVMASAPVGYLEYEALSSEDIALADLSDQLIPNASGLINRKDWEQFTGGSYLSKYRRCEITDVTQVRKGKVVPLWWRHKLPENTVNVSVRKLGTNEQIRDDEYVVDLERSAIFTNLRNSVRDGRPSLYLVTAITNDGVTYQSLLNLVSAIPELSFRDYDEEGNLISSDVRFTISEEIDGWRHTMTTNGTYYVRPEEVAFLKPLKPITKSLSEPWYPRCTTGKIRYLNRVYGVPESIDRAFNPYAPYMFTEDEAEVLSKRIVRLDRRQIVVDVENYIHLEMHVYRNDDLYRVYGTDASKEGNEIVKGVFYDSNAIKSWDQKGGFVLLAKDVEFDDVVKVRYHYEAEDYEYLAVDLNPTRNRKMKDLSLVLYVKPDENPGLHHILVDSRNRIVEISDPAYALTMLGTYNPNTLIGKRFRNTPSAFSEYLIGGDEETEWLILGIYNLNYQEKLVRTVPLIGDRYITEEALERNPRLLYSQYHNALTPFFEDGVKRLKLPLEALKTYGGYAEEKEIEDILAEIKPAGVTLLKEWDWRSPTLTLDNVRIGEIDLTATYCGAGEYHFWRRANESDVWEEIDTQLVLVRDNVVYVDSVPSRTKWYYAVSFNDLPIKTAKRIEVL